MKEVYARCAGLDVHKDSVSVCLRLGKGKRLEVVTAVFGTFTEDLERLRSFLRENKIRRLVMESTGVYWIPVWNVLEGCEWKFDVVLANPQQVRALPGEKTDHKDCKRLAELGQHGLVRGSFIPPPEIRELRDLTRQRTHLQGDRNRVINRIGRLLETVNYKLGTVVSNIVGKTGWLILKAIAAGQSNPEVLAELAQGSLQMKKTQLVHALHGYPNPHFRWLLAQFLDELSQLDRKLNELDARLRERMQPHAELVARLSTIPGVQETTAWTLIAELGTNMNQFPDAAHASSWAGLCPGNEESAGKRHSGRTRKGDRYLRRMLIQNAWAVSHKKDCFLTALFYRIASRKGLKRAAMAVAHRILIIAYHIMRDGTEYREVGGDYYDRKDPHKTAARLVRRLEHIGFEITLTRPAQPQSSTDSKPRKVPLQGTSRWDTRIPIRKKKFPTLPPATPDVCPRCAGWGIACIHARNHLNLPPSEG
jgi:transposase